MIKISELFYIENAKSKGYEFYEKGDIPFVSNGNYDYSIVGKVKVDKNDKVIKKDSICLSSFCEATVQSPPYLPRGNGGSGLIILIPKKFMSKEELFFYASQINSFKWRFSFSRMVLKSRIENILLFPFKNISFIIDSKIMNIMPVDKKRNPINFEKFTIYNLKELCYVNKKAGIPISNISGKGNTPYISSTTYDNGVVLMTDEKPNNKAKSLTVAKDGNDGISFYQPFDFITSHHNFVITLKDNYPTYFLLYIGSIIKLKTSRYNHYYPLSKKHLERLQIDLPAKNNKIDYRCIKTIVENCYGYNEFKKYL